MATEVVGAEWSGLRWTAILLVTGFLVLASAQGTRLEQDDASSRYINGTQKFQSDNDLFTRVFNFLWQQGPGLWSYEHVWPVSLIFISLIIYFEL